MVKVVALVELQVSVDDPPPVMFVGLALMLTVGRGFTVTVAVAVTDP